MIFTDCLHAEESPCREVYKQKGSVVMIFYSEISVFIFKQKGRLSWKAPISFLLTTDKLHPPPLEAVIIFIVLWIISKRIKYSEGLLLQTKTL